MNETRMTMELRPLHGGAYTQLVLKGPVVATPSGRDFRRLLAALAFWHGRSLHIVLSVAGTEADVSWAEAWDEVLREVPRRHVDFTRYEVRGITLAAPIGHQR
jgi:hypothetical protein